jgi:hypothetical protein
VGSDTTFTFIDPERGSLAFRGPRMSVTLKQLFTRIAGKEDVVTKAKLQTFLEDAGVSNSFPLRKASMAAGAFMDKFDDGSGAVGWDRFRKQGRALVPPGLPIQVDPGSVAKELEGRWSSLDKAGKGEVDLKTLTGYIEAELVANGKRFAGTKAEAGALVLLHALDENRDQLLQKEELKGFLVDVAQEAARG